MSNSESFNRIARQILLLFIVGISSSCNSSPTALASSSMKKSETATNTPTLVQTASPTESSGNISGTCPFLAPLPNDGGKLSGVLLFDHIKAIRFPDIARISVLHDENKVFSDPVISPDGEFLATDTALYDTAGNYLQETLDIYSSNGEIVASEPWNKQVWSFIRGWAGKDVVIQTTQANSLVAFNPFFKTSRDIILDNTTGEEISIIAYDPSLQTVAYYYPNDPGTQIRMVIWDLSNKKEMWSTQDLYYPMISTAVWSYTGSKVAIATLPINESRNHSEITVVDNDGNANQISNFRKVFEQIQIVDMKWSVDDKKLFFWAWTEDKNITTESDYDLYDIDINTGVVSRYCITGDSHNNAIVWLAHNPQFFVINDYTNYDVHNGIYEWDVLLIDSANNKAYKLGEDFTAFGWMKSP